MREARNNNSRSVSCRLSETLVILMALGASASAYCQQAPNDNSPLRRFEKGVQTPSSQPSNQTSSQSSTQTYYQPPSQPYQYDPFAPPGTASSYQSQGTRRPQSDDLVGDLMGDMLGAVVGLAGEMGVLTLQRMSSSADVATRREEGDILLPFVRYDFFRQHAIANIYATDHRLEVGYGPVALLVEKYTFYQQPNDSLTINRKLFLYRMSPVREAEIDLGFGESVVSGLQNTSLGTFSLPITVMLGDNVALEFRPTWSHTMDDYEGAIHLGGRFGSVKLGYRYLSTSGAVLNGPFAGFSLYY